MSYEIKYADVSSAKINPLEGGDSLANAEVPIFWTPAHVSRRLLEAFKIDDRMQRIESPKDPGSAHPAIAFTPEEIEEQLTMALAEQAAGTHEPLRFRPSKAEEAFMETCFDWLQIVRAENTKAFFSLRTWMLTERRGRSHRDFCRRNGIARVTFINQKDAALFVIATTLNTRGVGTF